MEGAHEFVGALSRHAGRFDRLSRLDGSGIQVERLDCEIVRNGALINDLIGCLLAIGRVIDSVLKEPSSITTTTRSPETLELAASLEEVD